MKVEELISDSINELCFLSKAERYLLKPFWIEVEGARLACYYNLLNVEYDTLIIFHGNGETASDYRHTYLDLLKLVPINIFVVEYRGYGESTGKSNFINCLSDAEKIISILNVPSEKIIFFGRSFGAIPAIHMASKYGCRGLVLENGIYDVKEWLIRKIAHHGIHYINIQKLNNEIDYLLNNKNKIISFSGKLLILHCRFDMMVPYEHATKVFEDANDPKELISFKVGIHNIFFSLNKDEISSLLSEFIND